MTNRNHVLFIVDQSSGSDTALFSKVIRETMRDRDDSFDVYTFADKGRLRVQRNVGNLTIRPLKSGRTHINRNVVDAVDGLGERLEVLSPDERPEHILVVLLTDHVDDGAFTDAQEAIEVVSDQTYIYKWKFMIGGDSHFEVSESLHLTDSNVFRVNDVNDTVCVLQRLLDDLRRYGDCGTFAEDR